MINSIKFLVFLSFISTTFYGFFEARAEIQNKFGSNENFKICFRDLLTFSFYWAKSSKRVRKIRKQKPRGCTTILLAIKLDVEPKSETDNITNL